jgi:hypothetical protein
MTSRVLSSSELASGEMDEFLFPGEADRFPGAIWNAHAREAFLAAESEEESGRMSRRGSSPDGSCLRGTAIALGMEAAVVLAFVAARQLWLMFQ